MSMIPSSIIAKAGQIVNQQQGVFGKLSPDDNNILGRQLGDKDLQFPQELGENEYNQFILFTSYENAGEKTSSQRRAAQRNQITLGEDIDVADEKYGKIAQAGIEAQLYRTDLEQDRSELYMPPANKGREFFTGPGSLDSMFANQIGFASESIRDIEFATGQAKEEVDRLTVQRQAAQEIADESELSFKQLTDASDSTTRSHESFIQDRSRSTIEQQKLLGVQRRVSAEGRLRFTSSTEKSNSNIALYLPNKLVNSGSIGYNNVNFEIAKAVESLTNFDFEGLGGLAKRAVAGVIDDAASIAGVAANAEAALTQVSGLAINPRMQQTFQGVNARGFDFTFSFAPKNQKEAVEVSKIIRAFRKKAHPSLAVGGTFLNLPDEFEIRYYKVFNNGVVAENLFLNKLGRCALTAINVDYTPNGINATFPDGSPVRTSLTMQFTELRPLVREDIEEGY